MKKGIMTVLKCVCLMMAGVVVSWGLTELLLRAAVSMDMQMMLADSLGLYDSEWFLEVLPAAVYAVILILLQKTVCGKLQISGWQYILSTVVLPAIPCGVVFSVGVAIGVGLFDPAAEFVYMGLFTLLMLVYTLVIVLIASAVRTLIRRKRAAAPEVSGQ